MAVMIEDEVPPGTADPEAVNGLDDEGLISHSRWEAKYEKNRQNMIDILIAGFDPNKNRLHLRSLRRANTAGQPLCVAESPVLEGTLEERNG